MKIMLPFRGGLALNEKGLRKHMETYMKDHPDNIRDFSFISCSL
jgi:hypothetical protein